jgi:hypothetical protein
LVVPATSKRNAPRRFPPPWSVEDIRAACVVKDSAGRKLGYFYYDEEPGRRDGSGTAVKEKSPRQPAGQRIQLRTFPTVRRKNSSSKYNVRVAPLMLYRLPTGDPLDLEKN